MNILSFPLYALVALALGLFFVVVSRLLNRKETETIKPGVVKVKKVFGRRRRQHSAGFFNIMLIFLLFNVKVFLFFPWIMIYHRSPISPAKPLMMAVFCFFMVMTVAVYLFILFSKGLEREESSGV